jgi:hypothetical protein
MKWLFLVSCVAGKRPEPTPAADLYTSARFQKARSYVHATGSPWFILSAEHGLLAPDAVTAPYERTLNTMPVADRRAWAERVQRQMDAELPEADEVIVLAGNRYRQHLVPYIQRRFAKVTVPMEGLTIGRQLAWLDHATTR